VTDHITEIRPAWAVPGARVTIVGAHLPLPAEGPPHVLMGGEDAHVVAASPHRIQVAVPPAAGGGMTSVHIDELPGQTAYLEVGRALITGIHQVDNPLFDARGQLYATESGTRGNRVAAPLFRVSAEGTRDPLKVDIANPTSLALGPDEAIYVSSRFEGHVYRVGVDGSTDLHASELGVATGLAFGPDGALYVGDRSGDILRVLPDRTVEPFASVPASVAAFHLAFGPGGVLYVAAPTLASRDQIYRITPDRLVDVVPGHFGRPQGIAFDSAGTLYVADALAGSAGVYRLDPANATARPELVLAAPSLVGLAFDPAGGLVVASNDTLWRLDVPLKPWRG
jgi:sugar lactone lactonase YvrE